jgi:hypothetical protein
VTQTRASHHSQLYGDSPVSLAWLTLVLSDASTALAALSSKIFASIRGLNLVGHAAVSGKALRLTRAKGDRSRAVWFFEKQAVASGFETTFQFQTIAAAFALDWGAGPIERSCDQTHKTTMRSWRSAASSLRRCSRSVAAVRSNQCWRRALQKTVLFCDRNFYLIQRQSPRYKPTAGRGKRRKLIATKSSISHGQC